MVRVGCRCVFDRRSNRQNLRLHHWRRLNGWGTLLLDLLPRDGVVCNLIHERIAGDVDFIALFWRPVLAVVVEQRVAI